MCIQYFSFIEIINKWFILLDCVLVLPVPGCRHMLCYERYANHRSRATGRTEKKSYESDQSSESEWEHLHSSISSIGRRLPFRQYPQCRQNRLPWPRSNAPSGWHDLVERLVGHVDRMPNTTCSRFQPRPLSVESELPNRVLKHDRNWISSPTVFMTNRINFISSHRNWCWFYHLWELLNYDINFWLWLLAIIFISKFIFVISVINPKPVSFFVLFCDVINAREK